MLIHTPSPRTIPEKSSTPWNYLEQASLASLQSFELNRLNHAANILKEITVLLHQYIDETSAANVARIFMQHRRHLDASQPRTHSPLQAQRPLLTLPAG